MSEREDESCVSFFELIESRIATIIDRHWEYFHSPGGRPSAFGMRGGFQLLALQLESDALPIPFCIIRDGRLSIAG